jgi:hypothetical protein
MTKDILAGAGGVMNFLVNLPGNFVNVPGECRSSCFPVRWPITFALHSDAVEDLRPMICFKSFNIATR